VVIFISSSSEEFNPPSAVSGFEIINTARFSACRVPYNGQTSLTWLPLPRNILRFSGEVYSLAAFFSNFFKKNDGTI
jgi:hypothetical protein